MGRTKKIKLETIAKETGISVSAVSLAISGKKGVGEKTRKLVLEKARELGYEENQPRDTGKDREKAAMAQVFIAQRYLQESPAFYMEVYRCIADEAMKRGVLLTLRIVTEDEENEAIVPRMPESPQDACMVIGEMKRPYLDALKAALLDTPLIFVDYYDVDDDVDCVVTDGFRGMEEMTRLLLDQGLSDLVFVGNVHGTKNICDRYLGCCKALIRVGRDPAALRVIPDRTERGILMTPTLPDPLPQAFLCNCDTTAYKVMELLEKRGIRVGSEISVAGFDNFPPHPDGIRLATYKNDPQVIARIAVQTMMNRLDGEEPQGVRFVEGTLIHGESVRYRRRTNGKREATGHR
jgi:DNA-binding LacI/PurR family transcriptional regulator